MLKLSKITLLLLGALGISSLSGCGTIALLEQCASGTGTNAICPDDDALVRASDGSLVDSNGRVVVLPDGTVVEDDEYVIIKDGDVITYNVYKRTPDVAVTADTLAKLASVAQSEDVVGIRSAVLADIEEPSISTELVKQVAYTEKAFKNFDGGGFAFYSFESDSHEPAAVDKVIPFDGSGESHREALKYVGVLPNTDVGNALRNYHDQARDEYGGIALSAHEEIPALAFWTGQVTVVVPEMTYSTYYVEKNNAGERINTYYDEVGYVPATSDLFNLTVDFKTQQISSETILIPVPNGDDAYNRHARIWGDFGVSSGDNVGSGNGDLAPGQLTGYFDFNNDDISPTPMTGIIGEKGAVGVFSDNNYFGGFVAVPK